MKWKALKKKQKEMQDNQMLSRVFENSCNNNNNNNNNSSNELCVGLSCYRNSNMCKNIGGQFNSCSSH